MTFIPLLSVRVTTASSPGRRAGAAAAAASTAGADAYSSANRTMAGAPRRNARARCCVCAPFTCARAGRDTRPPSLHSSMIAPRSRHPERRPLRFRSAPVQTHECSVVALADDTHERGVAHVHAIDGRIAEMWHGEADGV